MLRAPPLAVVVHLIPLMHTLDTAKRESQRRSASACHDASASSADCFALSSRRRWSTNTSSAGALTVVVMSAPEVHDAVKKGNEKVLTLSAAMLPVALLIRAGE